MLEVGNGVGVSALGDVRAAEIVVAAKTIGGDGNDLAEHFRRFVIAGSVVVEGAQPAVSGPIVRPQFNGLLIGFLCLGELAEAFVGSGQPTIGVIIGGLGVE